MIKKIHIKNYQGHKDTVLDLGPGINSVIGANDSGKTSIFRAIHWILTNRPLGNGFIRKKQSNNALVEIETDSCIISREKGKSVNEYRISKVEEPYTSFGQNPPEDIMDVFNFNEVNIQSQLEIPYLVLASPGQIAQHIRSISGLDIIDKVSNKLKNKISSKSTLLTTKKEELEKIDEELSELEKIDIDKIEKLITSFEESTEENKYLASQISQLEKIISELIDVEKTWIALPENINSILENTNIISKKLQKKEREISSINIILEGLTLVDSQTLYIPENIDSITLKGNKNISTLQEIQYEQTHLQNILEELLSIEVEIINLPENLSGIISRIEPAENQYNNINKDEKELNVILLELDKIETEKEVVGEKLQTNQKELFSLLDKITICPYCTSELNKETKGKLLKNY